MIPLLMLRKLLLPWFVLRLGLVIIPSFVLAILPPIPPLVPILASMVFFWIILTGQTQLFTPSTLPAPAQAVVTQLESLRPSPEVETELQKWLSLYEQQPTHRDTLINLAHLYEAAGDEEKAEEFWAKAHAVDPNYFTDSN